MRGNWLRKWWVWVLIAMAALTILFTLLPAGSSAEDVRLAAFIADVRAGIVADIEVDAQEIEYHVAGGERTLATKMEQGDTVRQVLQDAGVDPEDFPPIAIKAPSFRSKLPGLLFTFLPIVFIVAILYFFLRQAQAGTKAVGTDPVCGKRVGSEDAAGSSTFLEVSYRFCSPDCKKRFDADPVSYLLKS
jgi:YHS domain-containing protein